MTEKHAEWDAEPRAGRRAGRPSAPVLSRGLIADAALAIVTGEGQGKLTMKHLAAELGVSVSALYNHIANKAELMLLVQDAVMSRVDTSAFERLVLQDEREMRVSAFPAALEAWARSYREVFAEFPALVPLIATMPVSGAPETRRMYDAVSAGMLSVGVREPVVIPVIVAFESFLYGSAMDANAPATIFRSRPEETDAPTFQSAVTAFTDGVDAGVGQTVGAGESGRTGNYPNPYAGDPFEWGLASLIGQAVSLASPTSPER